MTPTDNVVEVRRALVIEDDPDVATLLRVQLRREGFAVEVASCGAAGIERARASLPDLVVLDLRMKPVDGFEVLTTLTSDPATSHIPILVVSILDAARRARRAGASAFVAKPFEPAAIISAVRRLVS